MIGSGHLSGDEHLISDSVMKRVTLCNMMGDLPLRKLQFIVGYMVYRNPDLATDAMAALITTRVNLEDK